MMPSSQWARAHTNIALIKYWGKKDPTLMLPANDSLSLTLANFYTDTLVRFRADCPGDNLTIDGQPVSAGALTKVVRVLDEVRRRAGLTLPAQVISRNHVPTAAGLASSASGLAALAAAAAQAAGLHLTEQELSRIARHGSGSATRSVAGGFVRWYAGTDDASSYALPVAAAPALLQDIRVLAVIFSDQPKAIGSTAGMAQTVATSSYFPAWTERAERDLQALLPALAAGDFARVGAIAEGNALAMHALTWAAQPPFTYFLPATLALVQGIQAWRAAAPVPVYATVDAGPNVKLLTLADHVGAVQEWLAAHFPTARVVVTHAGPGIQYFPERKEPR